MKTPILSMLVMLAITVPAFGQKMPYEEAKRRIQKPDLPEFWIGDVADLSARWEKLEHGKVACIAESPGGRPLHVIAYGEREPVEHKANFNSAIGGRQVSAYMDKNARKKPVIFFVGPVHGHEVEGLTGLVNLVQVMETGRDLAGRDQSELRELGRRCRLLILPAGNPDGVARFEPRTAHGMPMDEFQFWGMGTWSDERIAVWPASKRQHPRMGKEIGWMGCYFNDTGINPMHDEFFAPMGPEAPAILRVAMEEGPDLAVSLHSHGSSPVVLRPAYVPMEIQAEMRSLAERFNALMAERSLPHGGLFDPKPESGEHPAPFNLTSAIYHVSGAATFTFECPHGIADDKMCQVTFDHILDVQLGLYEAMLRHSLERKGP
ncbi:MAG: M14 family zinc carboxypeptidase [Planctomycetota bacterium]